MKPDWIGTIRLVMVIAAVVIAAAVIVYGDESAAYRKNRVSRSLRRRSRCF